MFFTKRSLKKTLLESFWNQPQYIKLSHQFSKNTQDYYWMNILKQKAQNKKRILDIGSTDGTRLKLLKVETQMYGLDIAGTAISIGRKKYPTINFIEADAEKIPFPNSYFDLTYTAFCLEHFIAPEKVISEMIRVTKKNGQIIFVCPNYGSPLINSPSTRHPRILKFIKILNLEILHFLKLNDKTIRWEKIQPKITNKFQPDDDAVNLPYLPNLIWVMKSFGLEIEHASSGWEVSRKGIVKILLFFLKKLGITNLYPIKYWGPDLFLICTKKI
ncbi:MAG: Methyltransferase type 11 [uncultured bacterium]|uniref:Methyltransferase type 11 domain-containing protein n=1 Tax=Candidatus Curtissbacteria bacterium RIFOXYA1_FULL_41_14 TaxID=1797737 RepID=A0A1F5HG38_9BACT|nr:MAG: Methyltransferase type 11 [uncultured bacterium]KKR58367.1 MAG: Methyltransferase type 11 [Candidatus Curtissbacteria bacterium GW2011_GWB1_40_28]KKR77800.1 MAG: Methyltransferase type 11 [Candidatus Curtissbacteria bacterium GW2011_GWD1_40_8]KKS01437.1 MAG: Methyltransferase type 11 [Candidatus Curtissbacteria bacterium GW2011_GWC2_41_21]OGE03117.1 MAG: hypothetical protein A2196_04040 [Candidatus Curtissbacteria bacterium RIFOXYA1_FULL_41_14]OGE06297.1 MAG: hypothetical protein A2362